MNKEILIIADIHGNFEWEKIQRIVEEKEISDVFVLGDFPAHGNVGRLEGVENFLEKLLIDEMERLYAIPGNCDSMEILKIFEKFKGNYHNKIGNVEGIAVDFIFFGGSNITPFNTIFEYNEEEIYHNLKELFESATSDTKILLTHCPPSNTNCDLARGTHIGSTAIRKIIEEFQPEINFCSHVHEGYGKEDFIGKTRIVNVGKLKDGCAILRCMTKKGKTRFEIMRINFISYS